ncbi:dirigent protein 23-like [Lycium barbarum]|uniref:dirigent protein 23-like n=1 Tax=Lycium barbarum TaxID=112863 RepID=UPI00293E4131|nr:dirigent protein 23-like [Lycium barbarum]
MKNTNVVLLLFFILMPIMAQGVVLGSKSVQQWFQKLPNAKQKITKFHFHLHKIASGKNPTAVRIAQSNMSIKSPTVFGFGEMIDDSLTVRRPEPNSAIMGRAQGIYGSADQKGFSLIMAMNFVFTTGRNPVFHQYREMPIVGGSGIFRLAQGSATAETYWFNTSGDAIVENNVMVLHY